MTTFELTWQPDNNRVPSDQTTVALQAKSMLWYMKAFAKGEIGGAASALYTCAGSSDAVTAGMDASDRWGGTFDASKIVRASGAVAHSWIVLYSVDLGGYWLIDYNTASDHLCNFYFSQTIFTGGSTTARPTNANEISFLNQQITNSSLTAAHMFGLLATNGNLIIKFGQDGTGQFTFSLSFLKLAESKTGDTHNLWPIVEYNAAGVWQRVNLNTTASTVTKGRNKDNTAAVIASLVAPAVASSSFAQSDIGTSDATDGLYTDFPIYLQVTTVAHKSRRGKLQDVLWAPEASPVGAVEPTGGPPYPSVVVGDTFQPYGGSAVPSL